MLIRKRLLFLSVPLLLLLLLITVLLTQRLLLANFDAEDQRELLAAGNALALQIDQSEELGLRVLRNTALSNDAFLFAQGSERKAFERRELDDDTLLNRNFNFILFFDNRGQLIAEHWLPLERIDLMMIDGSAEPELVDLRQRVLDLVHGNGLVQLDSHPHGFAQFVAVQGVPLVLTSSPISNNAGTAASVGTVVAGRLVTPQRIAQLEQYTNAHLQVLPASGAWEREWNRPPADEQMSFRRALMDTPIHIDGHRQQVSLLYRDNLDRPSLRMEVTRPRLIREQGEQLTYFFLALQSGAAVLLLGLGYFCLDRWVLRRISRVEAEIAQIGTTPVLPRVAVQGHDELASLCRHLNQMLDRLDLSERRERLILDGISDGFFECDLEGRLLSVNRALIRLSGWNEEQLLGHQVQEMLSREDIRQLRDSQVPRLLAEGEASIRATLPRGDGRLGHFEAYLSLVRDAQGYAIGVRGIVRDISAQLNYQRHLHDLAYRDPLTGLGNRKAFEEELAARTIEALEQEQTLTLMFIDLDHFKQVNDRYGHDAGDALLIAIGERLSRALRNQDLLFRVGGDEFIAVLPLTNAQTAEQIAARLLATLHQPVDINGIAIDFVTLSIGYALFPQHADNPEALVKAADSAMYQAKQQRNRACAYEPEEPAA